MDISAECSLSGADFIRQIFPSSPYVAHLCMQLADFGMVISTVALQERQGRRQGTVGGVTVRKAVKLE